MSRKDYILIADTLVEAAQMLRLDRMATQVLVNFFALKLRNYPNFDAARFEGYCMARVDEHMKEA